VQSSHVGLRMQVQQLLEDMFRAVQSCCLECVLLVPLIRVLSIFSLKRGSQPAACAGQRWQTSVFASCQAAIVACLEQLDQSIDNPERAHHGGSIDKFTSLRSHLQQLCRLQMASTCV
jgi:hypothetical protein